MIYSIRQMTRYLLLAITSVVALHALPLQATAQDGAQRLVVKRGKTGLGSCYPTHAPEERRKDEARRVAAN